MKITNNTILITGGSAGIGFQIAKKLLALGNRVIITGRDQSRLKEALKQLPGATAIPGDISNAEDTEALVAALKADHPTLNIVISNAGKANLYNLASSENAFEKAAEEMLTNYLSIIRLNEKLIPSLAMQEEAAIVNVSSVVAIVPGNLPTYSASKAALHSYTLSRRLSLAKTSRIKVFELMPPLVNTEFSRMIGGEKGIAPAEVADHLINGLAHDTGEIHSGNTQYIYDLYLQSPQKALEAMNGER